MKYTLLINQQCALKWGLTLSQSCLFDWLLSLPSWADSLTQSDGSVMYFSSRTLASKELPLVSSNPETIRKMYAELQRLELIEWKKFDKKDYVVLNGEKAKEWLSSGGTHDSSVKNIRNSRQKNDRQKYPTYKTTREKEDKTTNNKQTPASGGKDSIDFSFFPEQWQQDEEFVQIWQGWMQYRRESRKSYKSKLGYQQTCTKLANSMDGDVNRAKEAILHSIAQGYTGIFESNSNKQNNNRNGNSTEIKARDITASQLAQMGLL